MSVREDFEAWIDNPHKLNRRTEPGFTEEYEHPWTLGAWAAYQAATSLQEAKIKALRDSLNWALSNISEEPYEWSSEENTDAHNAAIAAAKETL